MFACTCCRELLRSTVVCVMRLLKIKKFYSFLSTLCLLVMASVFAAYGNPLCSDACGSGRGVEGGISNSLLFETKNMEVNK